MILKRENLGELREITEREQESMLELPTVMLKKEGKYFAVPTIDKRGKEQDILVYKTEKGKEVKFLIIYEVHTKHGISSKAVSFVVSKGHKDLDVLKQIVKDVLKDVEIKEILRTISKEDRKKLNALILMNRYEEWKEKIERSVDTYIDNNKMGLTWEVKETGLKNKGNRTNIELDLIFFIGIRVFEMEGTKFKLYRLLNTKDYCIKDFSSENLKQSNFRVENIKYDKEKDKIVGTNGVINRYGTVNGDDVLVILAEIERKSEKYYLVATNNTTNKEGKYIIKEDELVELAKKYGLANGKVVKVLETDKEHISSIKGEYKKITIE